MLTAIEAREILDNNLFRIFEIIQLQIKNNSYSFIFLDESFPFAGDKLSKKQINALLNLGYDVEKDTIFFDKIHYDAWRVSW